MNNMISHYDDTYRYNADNQRVVKTGGGETTYYIKNGMETLVEYDGNGEVDAEYFYGVDGIVAKHDVHEGLHWFCKDHLGSTRNLNNNTMQMDYYPFGEALAISGSETDYLFSGKELDSHMTSDLYYFGARYYNSSIGRWLVPDPLAELSPRISPYVYCHNNPLRRIDHNGLWDITTEGSGTEDDPIILPVITVTAEEVSEPEGYYLSLARFDLNELTYSTEKDELQDPTKLLAFINQIAISVLSEYFPNPHFILDVMEEGDYSKGADYIGELTEKVLKKLNRRGVATTPALQSLTFASVAAAVMTQSRFNFVGPDIEVFSIHGTYIDTIYYDPRIAGDIMEVIYKAKPDSLGNVRKGYTEIYQY